MSNDTDEGQVEMTPVTFEVPRGLIEHYDSQVAAGYYPTRDEAMRHALVEAQWHHRGRYSTLRLDIRSPEDKRPDTGPADMDEVLGAKDALEAEMDEDDDEKPTSD